MDWYAKWNKETRTWTHTPMTPERVLAKQKENFEKESMNVELDKQKELVVTQELSWKFLILIMISGIFLKKKVKKFCTRCNLLQLHSRYLAYWWRSYVKKSIQISFTQHFLGKFSQVSSRKIVEDWLIKNAIQ